MPKVVIDPGHGGYDPGAVGPGGLTEKGVNLSIGLKVRDLLVQHGIEVKMTRETDTSPGGSTNLNQELTERVKISEAFMGSNGLFVSIHQNSFGDSTADGTETLVYIESGNTGKAARLLQNEILAVTKISTRGIKVRDILVLRETTCPAVLTESVFLSNPTEANRLRGPNFLQALAIAHAKGILAYFGISYQESPTPPVPPVPPTPPVTSNEIYRVKVNSQMGAYQDESNALAKANELLKQVAPGGRVWIEQKSDGKVIWDRTK